MEAAYFSWSRGRLYWREWREFPEGLDFGGGKASHAPGVLWAVGAFSCENHSDLIKRVLKVGAVL